MRRDRQRVLLAVLGIGLLAMWGSSTGGGCVVAPGKYFTWDEMQVSGTAARLGLDNTPDADARKNLCYLVQQILDPLREQFGAILVTSAYRSPEVNDAIDGADYSDHLYGLAADIYSANGAYSHEDMATWLYQNRDRFPLGEVIVERHTGHLHVSAWRPESEGGNPRGDKDTFMQTSDGSTYTSWAPAAVA